MPELPEVETVKESLKQLILEKKIKNVQIYYDKIIKNCSTSEFQEALVNETFRDIKRVGKFLILILDNKTIVSHLRMEGKYFLRHDEDRSKHEHIIFNFTDGTNLRYHDVRKFGTMHLYSTTNIDDILKEEPLNKVAIDPLD